ncbi:AraC family transcriptional regulator [Tahibacter amnicola]|uniref:AraC family transcriptional regulator n=1 Tax=Tahibacter amnicola TaxID=2976241 RepID=A0ABY6BIT7_9GAMM|nr:AraC family transcriptional regulator [Tahibacter amnicola]UXI68290.1 AraC family transcriptional regulator [Tahibacter amnicola]
MAQSPRMDDQRLTTADLPTHILSGLVQLAQERNTDGSAWFAGTRLRLADVSDPLARVSYRDAITIVRRAVASIDLPELGLELGRRQNLGNFGLLGLAMKTARHFGEAIEIGLTYQRATGPLMMLSLDADTEDEVVVVAQTPTIEPDVLPFLCEEMFASLIAVAREMAGPSFRPRRADLAYPAPPYAAQYQALLQCPVRFDQPQNRLSFDRAWLGLPFPAYNPVTARQARAALTREIGNAAAGQGDATTAVERALRQRLAQNPRLQDIALGLHRSERTLRRQLALEGASFTRIHDRLRCERALELLNDRRLTITQIGSQVGFGDVREFRRAFKRWTGRVPSDIRDEHDS